MGRRDSGQDRAVSPVIGVILVVAIVVILAAVVGAYATSFGDSGSEPMPNVRLDATYNDDLGAANGEYLNVTMQGGDRAPLAKIDLAVSDATDGSGTPATLTGDPLATVGDEFVTRDRFSINATSFDTGNLELNDATVTLVWNPDPNSGERGQTQALWRWEAD